MRPLWRSKECCDMCGMKALSSLYDAMFFLMFMLLATGLVHASTLQLIDDSAGLEQRIQKDTCDELLGTILLSDHRGVLYVGNGTNVTHPPGPTRISEQLVEQGLLIAQGAEPEGFAKGLNSELNSMLVGLTTPALKAMLVLRVSPDEPYPIASNFVIPGQASHTFEAYKLPLAKLLPEDSYSKSYWVFPVVPSMWSDLSGEADTTSGTANNDQSSSEGKSVEVALYCWT